MKRINKAKFRGFPGGSDGRKSAWDEGDPGSIPGLGRSPGEGNGNPLQYSCLENPMEGGAWKATVHGVAKSRTRLSDFTFTFQALPKNAYHIYTLYTHMSRFSCLKTTYIIENSTYYDVPNDLGDSVDGRHSSNITDNHPHPSRLLPFKAGEPAYRSVTHHPWK